MKEDDMVDLEQFREAVQQWKMLAQVGETVEAMPVAFRKKPEEYTARIAEADRLLSIIDNAGKMECAEPDAWQFLPKGGGDSNWVTVPSPEPWREKGLPVRPLYAHQPAPAPAVDEWCRDYHCAGDCGMRGHGWQHSPVVDDPMVKRVWELYWRAEKSGDVVVTEKEMLAIARLIARTQEVQS